MCRLLNHMADHGYAQCVARNHDPDRPTEPFVDLTAGYIQRSIAKFPRQGTSTPWRLHQNYARDIAMLRYGSLEDEAMEFSVAPARAAERPLAA